ncbi:hypothetical protein M758_9G149600 [Ceratodon purpureus]|uniref:Uncharacterized protein n=1 Tax=Ceratodon purpureus TaxID=3225 RepID=A0A8T0GRU4_CERPU|nr:hypothetical protein KC19_9G142100 [Ceratodon purpureus]KAG0606544.1 hypothetical protein M758_9G149600 [Ceratodon purpureus]
MDGASIGLGEIRSLDMLRTRFTSLPEAFTKQRQPHQHHGSQLIHYTLREIGLRRWGAFHELDE